MPAGLEACQSRNNQLLLAAALEIEPQLRAAIERHGLTAWASSRYQHLGIQEASEGIGEHLRTGTLPDDYRYPQQELAAPAAFLAAWLGTRGPAYCISTACTSSARALLSARRLLALGVRRGDLRRRGFALRPHPQWVQRAGSGLRRALQPAVAQPQRHQHRRRRGAVPARPRAGTHRPAGCRRLPDAHHISALEPAGVGAQRAMRLALADAGTNAEGIHYLNLHGTATVHNDAMESHATAALFPPGCRCRPPPLTGHTRAAGALEAAFCWLALSGHNRDRLLPPHLWDGEADPELPALEPAHRGRALEPSSGRRLMSNRSPSAAATSA